MKKRSLILLLIAISGNCFAQGTLSLEDCRQLALEHNRDLKIAKENVEIANRMKKAAFAQFLPNFSANGGYLWNQKNISLLSADAHLPVGTIMADGSFGFTPEQINNQWGMVGGNPVPLDSNGVPFDPKAHPEKIEWKNYALLPKEAMDFDIEHIFAGQVGFTQPIYLGGKIRELYKLSEYAQDLAGIQLDGKTTDILVEVDEAYWRVVSVQAKADLAQEYKNLVQKTFDDTEIMFEEGVVTKADLLKVKVKLNEADLSLVRANNGLSLSRMALNQLCGLPIDEVHNLTGNGALDDNIESNAANMQQALDNRPEIRALEQMNLMAASTKKLAVSRFMPNIVATGNYMISNPNLFNGISKKFKGMFTVGVGVNIPIYHFGERRHTLKMAQAQVRVASLQLDDAKEKIELQVRQTAFSMTESLRKHEATSNNIESAEENLRAAEIGFAEGVISATDLLGAQSAWLAAKSDDIDASIEVRLNYVYLQKATGNLYGANN